MALEKPSVKKATEEARNNIRRVSAWSLPNNPSDRGMKPDEIKRAFWQPIIGLTGSLVLEQDRIVDEINAYLDDLYAHIGTGDLVEIDSAYSKWKGIGESGLTALANAAWRLLIDHDSRRVDVETAPRTDPHGTFAAIAERIRRHDADEEAHEYIRSLIAENDARIKLLLSLSEGDGRVFTIATWEDLQTALANPSERMFRARGLDDANEYARLLDLVTGDTILVLDKERPDFYVVTADRTDDVEAEVYDGVDLSYSDPESHELSGYLFTYGVPLTNLENGDGLNTVVSVDSGNHGFNAEHVYVFGKNIKYSGQYNAFFGEGHSTNSLPVGSIVAGRQHVNPRNYVAVFGYGNQSADFSLYAGQGNKPLGIESKYSLVGGSYNTVDEHAVAGGDHNNVGAYGAIFGGFNTAGAYSLASGCNNAAGEYAIVGGEGNQAADYSLAVGCFNSVGYNGMVSGEYNEVGNYGFASGYNNLVQDEGFASGGGNTAGVGSAVFGTNNVDQGFSNYIFGLNNRTYVTLGGVTPGRNFIAGRNNAVHSSTETLVCGFDNRARNAQYSFVSGDTNDGCGKCSFLHGFNNRILNKDGNDYNILIGTNNYSANAYDVLLGHNNTANKRDSYIIGRDNTAYAANSCIIGFTNTTHDVYSVAIGQDITLGLDHNYVMGKNCNIDGQLNSCVGIDITGTGNACGYLGRGLNSKSYTYVSMVGVELIANNHRQVCLGACNRDYVRPGLGEVFLQLGCGRKKKDRRTCFEVYNQSGQESYFVFGDQGDVGGSVVVKAGNFATLNRKIASTKNEIDAQDDPLVSAAGLKDYISKELAGLDELLDKIA